MQRFSVTPVRYLGGRFNQHWLVETPASQLVLRGYGQEPIESVRYEHEVLRRLHGMSWPVPKLVEEPIHESGRVWCLFTLLPGVSVPENGSEDRRERGRLLAQLHESTAPLADLGQRSGFNLADAVIFDPKLLDAIRQYEFIQPTTGHLLRWHLDKAREAFEQIELKEAETIVLHSDFAPWNLLFENGKLSGIIDFESTHLNYRVSDFALSWRGYQTEVIEGYEDVHPLTHLDWQLLVPAFWSQLFLGVKEEIDSMVSGNVPVHDFEWPTKQLLKRSQWHRVEAYPGP